MPPDIRSAHLFFSLNDAQLQRVTESSHIKTLKDGEQLFMAGDPARRFFLVLSGQIKLYRLSPEGNEKIIDIVQTGNSFAEALMFLDAPAYPVSASALGQVRVMSFENRAFLEVLRGSVDTCFRVMGTMSQRLRGLIKEIDDLTLQSAASRVCSMLLREMQKSCATEFSLSAPKGVLASRLSVKPETFSRILNNLSVKGVLKVKASRIEILDPEALREMAHIDSMVGLEPEEPAQTPCPMAGPKKIG